jgi:hypothetical protein
MFPEEHLLVLTRDGRDVVHSTVKTWPQILFPFACRRYRRSAEMDLCHRLRQAGWSLWWVPAAEVVHHGEASTRQKAHAMYVQLYRSKAQFHRKFGGERRARWFKFLLALAYAPRWVLFGLGQHVNPAWAGRARLYRRMVRELPTF